MQKAELATAGGHLGPARRYPGAAQAGLSDLWPNFDFCWLFAQFGLSARAVPVAQNLHAAFLRLGAIEDDVGWGGQLAHAGACLVLRAKERDVLQDDHSVNNRVPDLQGGYSFVPGDVLYGIIDIYYVN